MSFPVRLATVLLICSPWALAIPALHWIGLLS